VRTVPGEPRRGGEGPDVDRGAGHVRGRGRGADPSCSFCFRSILGDRLRDGTLTLTPRAGGGLSVAVQLPAARSRAKDQRVASANIRRPT